MSPAGIGGVMKQALAAKNASQEAGNPAMTNFLSMIRGGAPTAPGTSVEPDMTGNVTLPGIGAPPPLSMSQMAQENNFGNPQMPQMPAQMGPGQEFGPRLSNTRANQLAKFAGKFASGGLLGL
jgi:hypothetical protein